MACLAHILAKDRPFRAEKLHAIACAALIAVELSGPWSLTPVLAARPLVFVGRLSYSLYLWHFLVFAFIAYHASTWPSATKVILAWSAALTVAYASYSFVERPALQLKDRIGQRATPLEPDRALTSDQS